MPRYHPIAEGLWNDQKLEGAPFEEKAFFCFLCSNTRQRPTGIYRATDEQLSADTELPVKRVQAYLGDLGHRGLIVRDRSWIFVKDYFKRQPKQDRLLIGAKADVDGCDSLLILEAFSVQYPALNKWSIDRKETINRWVHGFVPSEQLQLQSSNRAVAVGTDRPCAGTPEAAGAQDHQGGGNGLDPGLKTLLAECPHLALVSNGESADFWDGVLGACEPYPAADAKWLGAKIRKWNQWFADYPDRQSRKRQTLQSRLMRWLVRDLEEMARRPW